MISNIQILRAYAAIIVVLFHAVFITTDYGFSYGDLKWLTLNIEKWGAFGVDIFFVVSGYIMFMINAKRQQTPLEFITNRIKRIVPIYWTLTLLIACLFLFMPSAFRSLDVSSEHVLSSLFFISKHFNYEYPSLYVGWTLEYEMFFYLVFGLILFLKNIKQSYQILLLTLIFSLSIAFDFSKSIIFEFIYGGVIFILFRKYNILGRFGNNNYWWILGVIASIIVVFVNNDKEDVRHILWGIPAALIFISVMLVKEIKFKLPQKLGDASYSIYLIQVFSLPLCCKILSKIAPELNAFFIFLLISVFTIVSGYIFYFIVECNFNSLLKHKFILKNKTNPSFNLD